MKRARVTEPKALEEYIMKDLEGQVMENVRQIAVNTTNISMIMKFGYMIIAGIIANVAVALASLFRIGNGNSRKKR